MAPVGHLVNSLPLTPGGIGVGETAFNALFSLTEMTGGADALLCLRIWSLLVGALGLLDYIFGMDRIVHWQRAIQVRASSRPPKPPVPTSKSVPN